MRNDNKKEDKNKVKYLGKFNREQENFLIERFKKEWLEIQKINNRDKQLETIKIFGLGAGKVLLGLAAVGGVLIIAAMAPNVMVVFNQLGKKIGYFSKKELDVYKSSYQKHSYFNFKREKDNYKIELTEKGKNIFLKSFAKNIRIKDVGKWDGRWWLVTFDIPRKHNASRDLFREKLKMIGMHQLQDSVFVSRYDCKDEVVFWASLYNISDFVHIARANFLTDFNI